MGKHNMFGSQILCVVILAQPSCLRLFLYSSSQFETHNLSTFFSDWLLLKQATWMPELLTHFHIK